MAASRSIVTLATVMASGNRKTLRVRASRDRVTSPHPTTSTAVPLPVVMFAVPGHPSPGGGDARLLGRHRLATASPSSWALAVPERFHDVAIKGSDSPPRLATGRARSIALTTTSTTEPDWHARTTYLSGGDGCTRKPRRKRDDVCRRAALTHVK